MNHHALLDRSGGPRATARHLRPTLVLGAITTMAGFGGLALSSLPGVREMGLFAMAGIAAALLVALWGLPLFLSQQASPSRLQVRAAGILGGWAQRIREQPLRIAPLVGAALAVALLGLPRIHWADDPAGLTRPDSALIAEDTRVRERVSQLDPGRLLIALADSEEEALALNERVWERVEKLRATDQLGSARSLYAILWSHGLQRRNRELLSRDPSLPDRIEAIFVEAGFRPGSFTPFREALADPEPPPLRAEDLEKGPLGRALRSMLVRLGERHGAITYLGDVHSPEAVNAAAQEIPGVHYFDQHELLIEIYTRYRERSLQLVVLGCIFVFGILFLRYRAIAPTAAAFLPSLLVAVTELGIFGLLGVEVNLLGLLSLILVMGMGVDYGIFLVDSASDTREVGATMLSLLLSCITTLFVFGTLALSPQPALRAVGLTAGLGIALAFALAPCALTLLPAPASERPETHDE
jgi:predicted exporter